MINMDNKEKAIVILFVTIGLLVGYIMGSVFMYGAIVAGVGSIVEKINVKQVTIGLNETALAQAVLGSLDHSILVNATTD